MSLLLLGITLYIQYYYVFIIIINPSTLIKEIK